MTIQEALKSGRNYKRKGEQSWRAKPSYSTPQKDTFYLTTSSLATGCRFTDADILADDWEVEEERIEITRDKLSWALSYYAERGRDLIASSEFNPQKIQEVKEAIYSSLGFKS